MVVDIAVCSCHIGGIYIYADRKLFDLEQADDVCF